MPGKRSDKDQLKTNIGMALNAIDLEAKQLSFDAFLAAYESVLVQHLNAAIEMGAEAYLKSVVAERACGMAILHFNQPFEVVEPLHARMKSCAPRDTYSHATMQRLWCEYLIRQGLAEHARAELNEFRAFASELKGSRWDWVFESIRELQRALDSTECD